MTTIILTVPSLALFRRNALLFLLLASIAVMPSYSWAESETQQSKQDNLHYKLVMSQDDTVCKPLTDEYNELLAAYSKVWLSKKLNAEEKAEFDEHALAAWIAGWATDFEVWESKKFEKIGFVKPPKAIPEQAKPHSAKHRHIGDVREDDTPDYGDYEPGLYLVDLFNEGSPRIVDIYDGLHYSESNHRFGTTITVFKKGVSLTDAKNLNHDEVDPALVDRDASFIGLVDSQKDLNLGYLGYVLTKWPNFERLYNEYLAEEKRIGLSANNYPPAMGAQLTTSRIFMYSGKPYFVLNDYSFMKPSFNGGSQIVVYRLTPSSHEDICYLSARSKL